MSQSSSSGLISLDAILNHATTTNNPVALNATIRNNLSKEVRDPILAGPMSGGQDPLSVLDIRVNSLLVLYILSARLSSHSAPQPPIQLVKDFCRNFTPEHVRVAPDRVTQLGKGIVRLAESMNNLKYAIQPLFDLLVRFTPSESHLTPIHPIFLTVCLQCRHFEYALPILAEPISSVYYDVRTNDNLLFHYTGGMILAALKRWKEAEEWFEICVSAPAQVPSAIQMEALKKLIVVQLIWRGKTTPLPKYTHPALMRILKVTPYQTFVNSYPLQIDRLKTLLEKERQLFSNDKTMGLLIQALDRAPRWAIKKLTGTYLTLGLAEIGKAVGVDEEDARSIILSMIETSEIDAQISAADIVSFSDPTPQFSRADVDRVLREAQEQGNMLKDLEMGLSRSRDYLSKAVKNRDESAWGSMAEEDMFGPSGGAWAEDANFS